VIITQVVVGAIVVTFPSTGVTVTLKVSVSSMMLLLVMIIEKHFIVSSG